jgi:hypothetical protein
MSLPVLICCFNRPQKTKAVLDAVKRYRPSKLYVSCDGPRPTSSESKKVAEVQAQFEGENGVFQIQKNFSTENLGCAKAVESGIKWFFENEAQGIVLEDDTVPEPEFFEFCEYHLEKNRNNSEIQGVSGNFLLPPELIKYHPEPAALTRYFFCWGWASWADRMGDFSLTSDKWSENEFDNCQETQKVGAFEKHFWKTRFQLSYQDRYPGWATKLLHQAWVANRKWIVPNRDLVVNIGFGEDSTNTKGSALSFFLEKEDLFKKKYEQERFPVQDEVQEMLRFQYIFNKDWAGVGNILAELELHERVIQLKQRVFELENLMSSPLQLAAYLFKSGAFRNWRL